MSLISRFAKLTVLAMVLWSGSSAVHAVDFPPDPYTYTWHELAEGVWSGVRENSPQTPVMGTSTFVIGDKGVIVFDGGGAPIMSERLMTKIASLTDKPITHLIISHWHGDHMFGVFRIVEEFPDVQVIAHPFTRAATLGRPMDYLKKQPTAIERYIPVISETLAKSEEVDDSEKYNPDEMESYRYIIKHQELLNSQFRNHNYTLPTLTFEKKLVIYSGDREIQLLHLGDANTEGDVIMWLPNDKIVATGDIIVLPTPYAFNTDPKKWADTLRAINQLGYEILVPGHGAIQRDMDFMNLTIETLDSIAAQTDQFIADGLSQEEAGEKLDFSAFDERFTGGDSYVDIYYQAYFVRPLRSSAYRAAMGEVMVKLERDPEPEKDSTESEASQEDS